jgi:hypothetical protein
MFHEAMAMEYRTIRFEIMQTANPCCWKWVAFLSETRMQTGIALTLADAVLDAESAIDNAYQQRVGELRDK